MAGDGERRTDITGEDSAERAAQSDALTAGDDRDVRVFHGSFPEF